MAKHLNTRKVRKNKNDTQRRGLPAKSNDYCKLDRSNHRILHQDFIFKIDGVFICYYCGTSYESRADIREAKKAQKTPASQEPSTPINAKEENLVKQAKKGDVLEPMPVSKSQIPVKVAQTQKTAIIETKPVVSNKPHVQAHNKVSIEAKSVAVKKPQVKAQKTVAIETQSVASIKPQAQSQNKVSIEVKSVAVKKPQTQSQNTVTFEAKSVAVNKPQVKAQKTAVIETKSVVPIKPQVQAQKAAPTKLVASTKPHDQAQKTVVQLQSAKIDNCYPRAPKSNNNVKKERRVPISNVDFKKVESVEAIDAKNPTDIKPLPSVKAIQQANVPKVYSQLQQKSNIYDELDEGRRRGLKMYQDSLKKSEGHKPRANQITPNVRKCECCKCKPNQDIGLEDSQVKVTASNQVTAFSQQSLVKATQDKDTKEKVRGVAISQARKVSLKVVAAVVATNSTLVDDKGNTPTMWKKTRSFLFGL